MDRETIKIDILSPFLLQLPTRPVTAGQLVVRWQGLEAIWQRQVFDIRVPVMATRVRPLLLKHANLAPATVLAFSKVCQSRERKGHFTQRLTDIISRMFALRSKLLCLTTGGSLHRLRNELILVFKHVRQDA